jgi:glycerol-3-phosphate responsive antiterminator
LAVSRSVDIPIIITVVNKKVDINRRLKAGASIINVAAGEDTPEVVQWIRKSYPDIPIIASGGNTEEKIKKTIDAGANAITFTPPSTSELFKTMMEGYRQKK